MDVPLLALFRAAAEQNHKAFAVLAEVHPVTRPEINSAFKDGGTYTLNVREIPGSEPSQSGRNLGGSLSVQLIEPCRIRASPVPVIVFPNVNHRVW